MLPDEQYTPGGKGTSQYLSISIAQCKNTKSHVKFSFSIIIKLIFQSPSYCEFTAGHMNTQPSAKAGTVLGIQHSKFLHFSWTL